jgi:hypothetical protein
MNPYTVHSCFRHATLSKHDSKHLTTAGSWDEIPFDNQLMIWRNVFEQERAERYRARVLRFQLRGFIGEAEWSELARGCGRWLRLFYTHRLHGRRRQAVDAGLEARLRQVLTALFRCDAADEMNVAGDCWAQIAFHIQAVLLAGGDDVFELQATSADGLHRIRLLLSCLPQGGPYVGVNIRSRDGGAAPAARRRVRGHAVIVAQHISNTLATRLPRGDP